MAMRVRLSAADLARRELQEAAIPRPAIVIDAGSALTKFGFAGEDSPRSVETAVAKRDEKAPPKMVLPGLSIRGEESLVGASAERFMYGFEPPVYPVSGADVTDFDALELLYKHCLRDMGDPSFLPNPV
jgi:actin-related protein